MYQFDRAAYEKRMKWFTEARFGMFIHYGLYSIPARGEWVMSDEEMSDDQYRKYFDAFDPCDLDMRQWAKAAKDAGMKYMVMTAKHHDGFCLYDSKYTDFKSTNTACHRDLIREYVDAVREQGLKVGLYFSLIDWRHPDFPHYKDRQHPMRNHPECGNEGRDFDRYLKYMHAQVRELMENYGKIDLLWLDFSYDDLRGEAWKATELVSMIRSLQPDIILNNRLEVSGEGFGSLAEGHPTPYHGDFITPEQRTLGLLRAGSFLQTVLHAGQKDGGVCVKGREHDPECRAGRKRQFSKGVCPDSSRDRKLHAGKWRQYLRLRGLCGKAGGDVSTDPEGQQDLCPYL